jgi:Tfp pilus assembly protein PilO
MKNLKSPNISPQMLIIVGLTVGGLLLGMIGYVAAVAPEKSRIVPIDTQIQSARASLIAAEQLPARPTPEPAQAADLFKLTKAMPDSDDIPGILLALTKIAQQSSVSLQGVTPAPDVLVTGYSQVPLTLQVGGTYVTITNFLRNLRRSVVLKGNSLQVTSRLFIPTSISLGTTNGVITATITLDAFTYGAPPTTTTTPASTDTTDTTTTTTG